MSEATVRVSFSVNGAPYDLDVPPRRLLSDALRHDLRLTGTHVGCEHGVCGACTVLLDGRPVRSCLMLGVSADGHEVTTVEGLTPAALAMDCRLQCVAPFGLVSTVIFTSSDLVAAEIGLMRPGRVLSLRIPSKPSRA